LYYFSTCDEGMIDCQVGDCEGKVLFILRIVLKQLKELHWVIKA
jgi:hypothetical protein